MKWRRGLGVVLLAVSAASGAAHSGGSVGYASIAMEQGTARYSLTLWPDTLPAAVAERLRSARAGHVADRDALVGVIRDKVALVADGRRCEAGPGDLLPPTAAESMTLVVAFACGQDARELLVRDDLFDVFGADYHTLGRVDARGSSTPFSFTPESREARIGLTEAGGGLGVGGFLRLGIEHIVTGWDHLLFLLGLLLRGGGWWSLIKIITAFTLAHSVTLALAALGIVAVPDRLVEAVIALSIAFVAAENLFLRPLVARRWLVSFCFGLVHGFGFSSVLREIGLPTSGLVWALLGFNAGVELGQALVVALAVPALILVRDTRWEARVTASASVAILLVGLVLFVERAFL
jgi:hypothetical protein